MIWQDILIMLGGFGFSIALLPSLLSKGKPARATCLITGGILSSYVVAMYTLELYLSALGTSITAALWWTLLFQRR